MAETKMVVQTSLYIHLACFLLPRYGLIHGHQQLSLPYNNSGLSQSFICIQHETTNPFM